MARSWNGEDWVKSGALVNLKRVRRNNKGRLRVRRLLDASLEFVLGEASKTLGELLGCGGNPSARFRSSTQEVAFAMLIVSSMRADPGPGEHQVTDFPKCSCCDQGLRVRPVHPRWFLVRRPIPRGSGPSSIRDGLQRRNWVRSTKASLSDARPFD